ncbi:MAG: hypothetical protein K8S15_04955, partial [Candidatus Aegiribacteria sp.]|nr:hypothetical protein [Candidatus Aegiribacteria sp.]
MKRSIESASLISILALLIGCAESNPAPEEIGSNTHQPRYDLMKVDSIGIESGDSNYVFGTIIDAAYLNDD